MVRAQTRVQRQAEIQKGKSEFRTAISLHSHTHHSKEPAERIPLFIKKVPVLGRVIERAIKRHEERTGAAIDFRRVYWTPPVSPDIVLASEKSQIEDKLGLAALVSITDHDTIAAPLELRSQGDGDSVPVSVEWTVPFEDDAFHIGVHRLPPARAGDTMIELSRYTAEPQESLLRDLFPLLDSAPETLVVLNHPCCDFSALGAARHGSLLRKFLSKFGQWIHALEFNAMRPRKENQEAVRIGAEYDLPVVAGGDRHGCRPNAVLNLTGAGTWDEYVAQIREGRHSEVLLMRAYDEPVRLREFQTIADIARYYPRYPYGRRQLTDRVFVDLEGYSWHPLSFYWSGGMPLWLRPLFGGLVVLGSDRCRPAMRWLLSRFRESALATLPSEALSVQEEGVSR